MTLHDVKRFGQTGAFALEGIAFENLTDSSCAKQPLGELNRNSVAHHLASVLQTSSARHHFVEQLAAVLVIR
jgi:hypothetical protein